MRLLPVALVLAWSVLATSTQAAGPFLVNGVGTPLVWGVDPIPFNPDRGTLGLRSNAQAIADVTGNFGVWAAVATARVSFVNAGTLPVDVTAANYLAYLGVCNDGLNPIIFDTDGSIIDDLFGVGASNEIVAFAEPDCQSFATATITEASAVLNGMWIDGIRKTRNREISLIEFNAVVRHEFGHYVNLDHSQINLIEATDRWASNDNAVATMYPFLVNGTEQATLNLDDVVSVSALYPGALLGTGFGRITGSVLLPNREGAFQGAHVVARKVGDPRVAAVGVVSGARFFPRIPGGVPAPSLRASYEIPGLPPGDYTVEIEAVDPRFTGESAMGPLDPPAVLPGPPEFWNGADESNTQPPDNPSSFLTLPVVAGGTHGGIDVILNGTPTGPPNDACTTPAASPAASFTTSLVTTGATTGIYDPFQACTAGGPAQNYGSVWYQYTPPASGSVTVATAGSNYDTVLSVYTGTCGTLAAVACNDDVSPGVQSRVAFAVTGGTTYMIEVTDFDEPIGGTLTLAVAFTAATPTPSATPTAAPSPLSSPTPSAVTTPTQTAAPATATPSRSATPTVVTTPSASATPGTHVALPDWTDQLLAVWYLEEDGTADRVNSATDITNGIACGSNCDLAASGAIAQFIPGQEGVAAVSFVKSQQRRLLCGSSSCPELRFADHSSFTVGCWARPTIEANADILFRGRFTNVTPSRGYRMQRASVAGNVFLRCMIGDGELMSATGTAATSVIGAFPANVWTHVACRLDSSRSAPPPAESDRDWQAFINGASSGALKNTGAVHDLSSEFSLGTNQFNPSLAFEGQLDECFATSTPLSDGDLCRIARCGIRGEQCRCDANDPTLYAVTGRALERCVADRCNSGARRDAPCTVGTDCRCSLAAVPCNTARPAGSGATVPMATAGHQRHPR